MIVNSTPDSHCIAIFFFMYNAFSFRLDDVRSNRFVNNEERRPEKIIVFFSSRVIVVIIIVVIIICTLVAHSALLDAKGSPKRQKWVTLDITHIMHIPHVLGSSA